MQSSAAANPGFLEPVGNLASFLFWYNGYLLDLYTGIKQQLALYGFDIQFQGNFMFASPFIFLVQFADYQVERLTILRRR